MFRKFAAPRALMLIAFGAVTFQQALAATCADEKGICPDPTKYAAHAKSSLTCPPDPNPPVPGTKSLCYTPSEQPTPVSLFCEPGFGTYDCEALPQSDVYGVLTYSWTASGSLRLPSYDPKSPFITPICRSSGTGTLTVTVHSPANGTASLSKTMTCS